MSVIRAASSTASPPSGFTVGFDNSSNPEATVIRVVGEDQPGLLMQLTGIFSLLDLAVVSANIQTLEGGYVEDVFLVTTSDGNKVITSAQ